MTPTFSVLIGSKGRDTLPRSLESIAAQGLIEGDQAIVAFDAFERRLADLDADMKRVESFGPHFIPLAHVGINASGLPKIIPASYSPSGRDLVILPGDPYHWLGVEQLNHAWQTIPITGSHTFTIGDDDVFTPGAYAALRAHCAPDPLRAVLYRFVPPWGGLLWDVPRLRPCLISGCCIAAPTPHVGLMHTRIETTHDYDWIVDVLDRGRAEGKAPIWLDFVGVVARPSGPLHPSLRYPPRVVAQVEGGAWT